MQENDSALEGDDFEHEDTDDDSGVEYWIEQATQPVEVPVRINVALEFCKLCMLSGMADQPQAEQAQAARNAALRLLTQYFYGEVIR